MTDATTRQPNVGWLVASWTAFVFACVSLLSYPLVPFARASMLAVFEDFDAELPTVTILVVDLPRAAFFITPLVLALFMLGVQLVARRKWVALVFHLLVMLASVVAVGVVVFALFLPLVTVMQSVQ